MTTVIIDYESGNLHSAHKAFERMSNEVGAGDVVVSDCAEIVARADRLVLPGDGAFPACVGALSSRTDLRAALEEAVLERAVPFLGICVGMQLLAQTGHEYSITPGLGWIPGEVRAIAPGDAALKVPHMGWNDLTLTVAHPVFHGIASGDHAYFVHSYQMEVADPAHLLASTEYGEAVTAIVGRDNILGMQFHPEKSQTTGLRLISNFLTWRP